MADLSKSVLAARFKEDSIVEIGIDEAGRGSFWGPIMAGAVVIPTELTAEQKELVLQFRDSKKISPKKRTRIAAQIKELLPQWAVGIVHANEINKHGITWANMEAFRRAANGIPLNGISPLIESVYECRLLIDGTLAIDDWAIDNRDGVQECIIEGDGSYMAIAGASILAKVAHDEWIQKYCDDNPECNDRYHLVKSKGYGTTAHRDGIKLYGGHELHRVLYIQNWLPGATHVQKTKAKTKSVDITQCLIKF